MALNVREITEKVIGDIVDATLDVVKEYFRREGKLPDPEYIRGKISTTTVNNKRGTVKTPVSSSRKRGSSKKELYIAVSNQELINHIKDGKCAYLMVRGAREGMPCKTAVTNDSFYCKSCLKKQTREAQRNTIEERLGKTFEELSSGGAASSSGVGEHSTSIPEDYDEDEKRVSVDEYNNKAYPGYNLLIDPETNFIWTEEAGETILVGKDFNGKIVPLNSEDLKKHPEAVYDQDFFKSKEKDQIKTTSRSRRPTRRPTDRPTRRRSPIKKVEEEYDMTIPEENLSDQDNDITLVDFENAEEFSDYDE